MLTPYEQEQVWKGMLAAEIRANYFADLSGQFARKQRFATWGTLVLSSSAFGSVVANIPPEYSPWVRGGLTLLAAALSAYSLVMQNQKSAIDASDLHARWNRLANEYARLWGNVYGDDAKEALDELIHTEEEVSKTGVALPHNKKLMEKWEDHVIAHHARELVHA